MADFPVVNQIGIAATSDSIMLSKEYLDKIEVDKRGSIIIPVDLIQKLNFMVDTKLEVLLEDEYIVIKKPHICKFHKLS